MRFILFTILCIAVFTGGGCSGEKKEAEAPPVTPPEGSTPSTTAFAITTTAFADGALIPARHTCDGEDLSPALIWGEPPAGTQTFALICDDPDAPAGTWVHWVVYDIPGTVRSIEEGVDEGEMLANGGMQGINSSRRMGYSGPCPPPGKPHRYFFKLYALDILTALPPGAAKDEAQNAIQGHIIAESQMMGTYKRR